MIMLFIQMFNKHGIISYGSLEWVVFCYISFFNITSVKGSENWITYLNNSLFF